MRRCACSVRRSLRVRFRSQSGYAQRVVVVRYVVIGVGKDGRMRRGMRMRTNGKMGEPGTENWKLVLMFVHLRGGKEWGN